MEDSLVIVVVEALLIYLTLVAAAGQEPLLGQIIIQ
jgi:hypothetical protein